MKRGFILVEFASAVAIIAILAAILFPVFARAREKARQSNCLTNMLNVGVSLRQYAADYCGGFPPNDLDFTPLLTSTCPTSGCSTAPARLARSMAPKATTPTRAAIATTTVATWF